MYSYEEFKERFKEAFVEAVPEEYRGDICFEEVQRINVKRDMVGIRRMNGRYVMGPCMYVSDAYEIYLSGVSIEEVARDTYRRAQVTMEAAPKVPELKWDTFKDSVVLQVISGEGNEDYLKGVPHRQFLNLAVIYRGIISADDFGHTSFVITLPLMQQFGISEEELYDIAYRNTPKMLPAGVFSMMEMLKEMIVRTHAVNEELVEGIAMDDNLEKMRVVTTSFKSMGAYFLIYPDFLKTLSEEGSDLFIIPSSIHELIVFPAQEDADVASFTDMIRSVNEEQLTPEERLSDVLYRYDAKENRVVIA